MKCSFSKSNLSKEFISQYLLDKYHNYLTSSKRLPKDVIYIESRDENGFIRNIFPISYSKKEGNVKIKNKFYLDVEKEEWELLLSFLFKEYHVQNININSVFETNNFQTKYPLIKYSDNVDNIAVLPSTFKQYIDSLGKQTKKHAKYYLGRILRDFPNVEYKCSQGEDISFEDYTNISKLSKERMESKYLKYNLTEEEDCKRFNDFFQNGLIYKVVIDGKTIAGCIGELIGEDFYLHKIAHDNKFSRYNLGQIALLKLIKLLINFRVKRFHFLWSKGVDYKIRFGGGTTCYMDILILHSTLIFLLQEIVHYESYGSKVFCFRRTKKKQKVGKATSSPNIQSKQIALS